jgi:hypothetical protein
MCASAAGADARDQVTTYAPRAPSTLRARAQQPTDVLHAARRARRRSRRRSRSSAAAAAERSAATRHNDSIHVRVSAERE